MVGETDICFYGSTPKTAFSENSATAFSENRVKNLIRTERRSPGLVLAERPRRLSDATVLTLDGYGTLVDRESGVINALMPWLRDVGVMAGHNEIIRAFAEAERASLTPGRSYRDVLVSVHDALAEFFGVDPDPKAAQEFASSIGHWPVHPEVPKALAYLKQHFQLVILTNADHAVFDVTNEALGVEFDAVYTAEDSGIFKPNTGMFTYLLGKLEEAGIDKRRVMHVAGSVRFDHIPAQRKGISTCWIHRKHGAQRMARVQKRGLDFHPDFQFSTLGGLADAHWMEIRNNR